MKFLSPGRWRRVGAVGALSALIAVTLGAGAASAQSTPPTRDEALAAIAHARADTYTYNQAHIRSDLAIVEAYVNSTGGTTPPPAASKALSTNPTCTVLDADRVRVDWVTGSDDLSGLIGWQVSRNGTDDFGTGTWTSEGLAPAVRSWTFNSLVAEQTYTFSVIPAQVGGITRTCTASTGGGITTPPTTTPGGGTGGTGTAAATQNWGNPVWTDEFNTMAGWEAYNDPGSQHGVRKPENCVIVSGVLEARAESNRETCGMASTAHRGQLYGRWEARVKSVGSGWKTLQILWPDSDVWPRDGERDWQEHTAGSSCFEGFIHYPNHDPQVQWQVPGTGAMCPSGGTSTWHNIAVEFTSSTIKFWVDGVAGPTKQCDADLCQGGPYHPTIQVDDQGSGNGNTATLYVDYLKFYNL